VYRFCKQLKEVVGYCQFSWTRKFCVFSATLLFLQALSTACRLDKCTLQTNPTQPPLPPPCPRHCVCVQTSLGNWEFLPVSGGYLILLITTHSSYFTILKRIKRIPIFRKNSESKKHQLHFFFKNFKEPQVLLKELFGGFQEKKTSGFVNGYLILPILRTMVIYIYQPGYFVLANHGYDP